MILRRARIAKSIRPAAASSASPRAVASVGPPDRCQGKLQSGQLLQRLVVKLARPASSLLLCRLDAPCAASALPCPWRSRRPTPHSPRTPLSTCSSQALKPGPSRRRSNAASTPSERPRTRSGTKRPLCAFVCSASANRSRSGNIGEALGRTGTENRGRRQSRRWESCARRASHRARPRAPPPRVHRPARAAPASTRVGQCTSALDDELQDPVEVGAACEGMCDLRARVEGADEPLELLAPRLEDRVAACVLDRDRRPVGEDDDGLFVLLVELVPPSFSVR